MKPSTRKVVFSHKRGNWPTPGLLFSRLDDEFHFTLDACGSHDNAKVTSFFEEPFFEHSIGAIDSTWVGTVWCNPPYGPGLPLWVAKAEWSARTVVGVTVVLLLPARTDTKWWHDIVMKAAEIRFIRGRIRFHGAKAGAPFPSVVVVFRHGHRGQPIVSSYQS